MVAYQPENQTSEVLMRAESLQDRRETSEVLIEVFMVAYQPENQTSEVLIEVFTVAYDAA